MIQIFRGILILRKKIKAVLRVTIVNPVLLKRQVHHHKNMIRAFKLVFLSQREIVPFQISRVLSKTERAMPLHKKI